MISLYGAGGLFYNRFAVKRILRLTAFQYSLPLIVLFSLAAPVRAASVLDIGTGASCIYPLVGVAEYSLHGASMGRFRIGALGFEVMLGSLTFTGSMMAFSKLQGLIRGTPITYKGQNFVTMILLTITLGSFLRDYFAFDQR